MKQRQALYRQLCTEQPIPLLSTASWMEATSLHKDWDVVFVPESPATTAEVQAALPYHLLSRWGLKCILMPQLTMLTRPFIREGGNADEVQEALAAALDKRCREEHIAYCYLKGEWTDSFRQSLSARGFLLEERHTHQLPPSTSREDIVRRFHENKRRQYRKAKGLHRVPLSEEAFYAFHAHCLRERGKRITYSRELLHALLSPLLSEGQAVLWGAADAQGQVLAAVGLVWDAHTCYYLLPAYSRAADPQGAMAWLTAEAILLAGEKGLIFDFEGGNEGGLARSYREFGGVPTTYHSAEKYYCPLFRLIRLFKK